MSKGLRHQVRHHQVRDQVEEQVYNKVSGWVRLVSG